MAPGGQCHTGCQFLAVFCAGSVWHPLLLRVERMFLGWPERGGGLLPSACYPAGQQPPKVRVERVRPLRAALEGIAVVPDSAALDFRQI